MKIGVSSYSYAQLQRAGKMTQFDCVAKAKEMGFDSIEFTDLMPPEGESNLSYAERICEEAKRCGIEVSAYVVGANLARKDPSEEIAKLKSRIDEAKALGAKFFRHDIMYDYEDFRSFDLALPTIAAAIREVTGKNVFSLREIVGDIDLIVEIVCRVGVKSTLGHVFSVYVELIVIIRGYL